jgi:hypothetical protein
MTEIPEDRINAYRAQTFRLLPNNQITSINEAISFVKDRGFTHFWPITGILLPSLWIAVAGDRPVSDEHDDPGHITWGWKDELLGKKEWYYAKILRKKGTMISFEIVPYFYALSENYGSPEDDYLTLYEQGRLTLEAKTVYETLLKEGAMDTITLRRATSMSSSTSDTRFNRAITDLQADFKVLPIRIADAGAWHYAYAYDIVTRHYPEIPEQARFIQDNQARNRLVETYLVSLGAVQASDITKLFGWSPGITQWVISDLCNKGIVSCNMTIERHKGEWIVLSNLIRG